MKRLVSWFLIVAMLFSLAACSEGGKSQQSDMIAAKLVAEPVYNLDKISERLEEENAIRDETIEAINRFSYNTSVKVLGEVQTNACYSPLSLYYALALAASGADGTTRDELTALLGIGDVADLSQQCGNLYCQLYTVYSENEIAKLKIANSLWLDHEVNGRKVAFKDRFLENATANFYASLFTVNFANEEAGEAMGRWISENTEGTITPEFEVNPDQIMNIINTVYFCDEWIDRFYVENTKADTFYLENGDGVTCDFMNITDNSSFYKGDGYIRSDRQLKGNGMMVFILPDEGTSVNDLLATPEKIQEIFTHGDKKYGKVVWSVPKFEYSSSFSLIDALKELGVKAAFSKEDADFSGMTDQLPYISGVTQETHISIDEKGVEASAYTEIEYVGAGRPEDNAEMILNRPFIYGIKVAGTLLVVGVCKNPAS